MVVQAFREDQRSWLTLTQALAEGAEGCVYAVPTSPRLLAKVFKKPSVETGARLAAMVADWQRHGGIASPHGKVVWPEERLLDARGGCVGYLMERVAGVEIHELYTPVLRQRLGWRTVVNERLLLRIAQRVAETYAAAERRGHFACDTNARNVLVDQGGSVAIIDADSFQITDRNRTHTSLAWTEPFAPPELQGGKFRGARGVETAWFSLAVLVFLLRNDGQHPFALNPHGAGKDLSQGERIQQSAWVYRQSANSPALKRVRPWNDVPPPEQRIYLAAFEAGQHDPGKRLSSAAIAAALADAERWLVARPRSVAIPPPPPLVPPPPPVTAAPPAPAALRLQARPPRRQIARGVRALATIALAIAAVVAWASWTNKPAQRPEILERLAAEPSSWRPGDWNAKEPKR